MDVCSSKSGQITIFMIVGIVLFVLAVFIIVLASQLNLSAVKQAQEEAFGNTFGGKESFRIYVEDCLDDTLTSGLMLLGSQGRIWQDQGGTVAFSGKGVLVGGIPVAYGIRYVDSVPANKYPCLTGTEDPFCMYPSNPPGTVSGFGELRFSQEVWESDLGKYLEQEVPKCVEQELLRQTIPTLDISSEGAQFDVKIEEAGVNVKVNYPLRFGVGDDTVFSTSEFSFLYPTRLKQFLDKAVLEPLENDWKVVSFALEPSVVEPLGVQMTKEEWGDDDIIELRPQWNDDALRAFVFRYIRQNRPPALEYVNRCPGEGYDYLVVEGVDSLGSIDVSDVYPTDPDEDTFFPLTFTTGLPPTELSLRNGVIQPIPIIDEKFKVLVSDSHGKSDWQEVRVKIEPKIEPSINFVNLVDNSQTISLEEPFCISIASTQPSEFATSSGELQFSLNNQELSIPANGLPHGLSEDTCTLSDYNENILSQKVTNSRFFPSTEGNKITGQGMRIQYGNEDQCGYDVVVDKEFQVKQCSATEEDENYPYPYIYVSDLPRVRDFYKMESNNRILDSTRSPFKAKHACCAVDNSYISSEGPPCFDQVGCFATEFYKEQLTVQCSGQRGNICNGASTKASTTPGKNICGSPTLLGCSSNLELSCENVEAYGYGNGGWCTGTSGCEEFCLYPIDVRRKVTSTSRVIPTSEYPRLDLTCATAGNNCRNHIGRKCDGNLDHVFDGICQADGRCSDLV